MRDQPGRETVQLSVLLVEDSQGFAYLVREFLEEWLGAAVVIAHFEYLAKAFEHLRETQVDVILLDQSLPDSDSTQTLPRMMKAAAATPVIVLSGLSPSPDHSTTRLVSYLDKRHLTPDSLASAILAAVPSLSADRTENC